jgi:hypothetical protein
MEKHRGVVRRVHEQPGRLAHWELTHSYRDKTLGSRE